MTLLVCKVGGSLFDWPELFPRLAELLASQSRPVLLIAGGGAAANVVREWDRRHCLGEARAHRLAIRALGLGEAFLADGLLRATIVSDRAEARLAWNENRYPILHVEGWITRERAELPASWDVTSDSIAAVVARRWEAELLLLKSTTPARVGKDFVDRRFSEFAQGFPVRWRNLRSGESGIYSDCFAYFAPSRER